MATITATGHLAAPPELKFTHDGAPRATFRLAETSCGKNRQTQYWEDTGTIWLSCVVFVGRAEAFVETVGKGTLVTVSGRLSARDYTTDQGEMRTSWDVVCDVAGVVPKPTSRVESSPF